MNSVHNQQSAIERRAYRESVESYAWSIRSAAETFNKSVEEVLMDVQKELSKFTQKEAPSGNQR